MIRAVPLHLVNTTPRKRARATDPRPAALLQCPRCASRETITTKIGVMYVDGKARGGTPQTLCAGCFSNGERVVLA